MTTVLGFFLGVLAAGFALIVLVRGGLAFLRRVFLGQRSWWFR